MAMSMLMKGVFVKVPLLAGSYDGSNSSVEAFVSYGHFRCMERILHDRISVGFIDPLQKDFGDGFAQGGQQHEFGS